MLDHCTIRLRRRGGTRIHLCNNLVGWSSGSLTAPLGNGIARCHRAKTLVATIHAQGAQVYECNADAAGKLVWQFREPIATLIVDGKTVGRHYAGPNWEMADGSAVVAKVAVARPARPRPTFRC